MLVTEVRFVLLLCLLASKHGPVDNRPRTASIHTLDDDSLLHVFYCSTSYLDLSLVCKYGTPVADMLVHPPSLPLAVDYFMNCDITTKDEEVIILTLKQHDRVVASALALLLRVYKSSLQPWMRNIQSVLPGNSPFMIFPNHFTSSCKVLPFR